MSLIENLPNEEYHKSPGVSKSMLDVFSRSPHHYWWQYKSGESPGRTESAPMRQGTIIHTAILEPDRFEVDYVVSEFKDKRTKAYKELVLSAAENEQDVLTLTEYDMAMRCRDSVFKNPHAAAAFADGIPELSAFINDPDRKSFE